MYLTDARQGMRFISMCVPWKSTIWPWHCQSYLLWVEPRNKEGKKKKIRRLSSNIVTFQFCNYVIYQFGSIIRNIVTFKYLNSAIALFQNVNVIFKW